jgi:hypothetical protein
MDSGEGKAVGLDQVDKKEQKVFLVVDGFVAGFLAMDSRVFLGFQIGKLCNM